MIKIIHQSKGWHRFTITFVLCSFFITSGLLASRKRKSLPLLLNKQIHRNLQRTNVTTEAYQITWDIKLSGKESLLQSSFLKGGLERSIKKYLNDEALCDNFGSLTNASYYSVEIINNSVGGLSTIGKCIGDAESCARGINQSISSAQKHSSSHRDDDFCAAFKRSTIFNTFKETVMVEFTFSYSVNVDVICQLDGALDINYDVTFQPTKRSGLDEIESILLDLKKSEVANMYCATSQCANQRSIIYRIFRHFGVLIDENKHECSYHGVNCDSNGFVTHISLGEYHVYAYFVIQYDESKLTLLNKLVCVSGL